MKKNKIFIVLIGFIALVLVVSWIIGFGVENVPNFLTYGTAGEWFSFWGSVAGGLMSTFVAGGVAYYISKNESERSLDRDRQIVKESVLMSIKLDHLKELKNNFDEMNIISDELGILFLNLNNKLSYPEIDEKETIIINLSKEEIKDKKLKLKDLFLSFFLKHNEILSKMKHLKVLQNSMHLEKYYKLTQETNKLIEKLFKNIEESEEAVITTELTNEIKSKIKDYDDAYANLLSEYYKEFYNLDVDSLK